MVRFVTWEAEDGERSIVEQIPWGMENLAWERLDLMCLSRDNRKKLINKTGLQGGKSGQDIWTAYRYVPIVNNFTNKLLKYWVWGCWWLALNDWALTQLCFSLPQNIPYKDSQGYIIFFSFFFIQNWSHVVWLSIWFQGYQHISYLCVCDMLITWTMIRK